mgnify:CR=1 FL=1
MAYGPVLRNAPCAAKQSIFTHRLNFRPQNAILRAMTNSETGVDPLNAAITRFDAALERVHAGERILEPVAQEQPDRAESIAILVGMLTLALRGLGVEAGRIASITQAERLHARLGRATR